MNNTTQAPVKTPTEAPTETKPFNPPEPEQLPQPKN